MQISPHTEGINTLLLTNFWSSCQSQTPPLHTISSILLFFLYHTTMSSTRSANTMKANASTYQEDQPTDIRPLMDKKSLRWIVVGGPPGHGKTTISVALVYDLARRGDRVLLVSMHALKPGTEAHAAVKAMYLPDDNEVCFQANNVSVFVFVLPHF